jgi:hypothetical protein
MKCGPIEGLKLASLRTGFLLSVETLVHHGKGRFPGSSDTGYRDDIDAVEVTVVPFRHHRRVSGVSGEECASCSSGSGAKMASGLPKVLAMTEGSARARLRPWQLSCPSPLCAFSPCRTNMTVSTALSLLAAVPVSRSNDNDMPVTAVAIFGSRFCWNLSIATVV